MITIQPKVSVHSYVNSELHAILDKIRTGGKIKDQIEHCRSIVKEPEYATEKKNIPAIIFQGQFTKRDKASLVEASGLMVLDFDHTGKEFKESLKTIPFIYVAFISLGGDGVKALVKIPVVTSDEEYKKHFNAIEKELNESLLVTLDTSGKDICRACFFSYDPDLYINDSAEVYTKKLEKDEVKPKIDSKYVKNDYVKAMIAINYIRSAQEGERHTKILKASRLMGGYIASGTISESEGKRLLEQEAYNIDPSDFQLNRRAIDDGIKNGMVDPLVDKLEGEIKTEGKYGKLYFTLTDVKSKIEDRYNTGISKGYWVGWPGLNEYYSLKMGTTTYIYGAPYSGKTYWWYEILINCSKFYGMKHVVFSPETGGADEVFIKLMETYVGRNFYNDHGNQMSVTEREDAEKFMDKHFIVVDPGDNILTVDDFYSYVDIIERKFNTKIHTTTVDPWNELVHNFAEMDGRQDIYLEWALGKIRQNAKSNDRHNAIITHITSQHKVKGPDGNMTYPPADFREIAGGQSWARKGMNMISLFRPVEGTIVDGQPIPDNTTMVCVQKVKPSGIGKKGNPLMYYDFKTHRFYEDVWGERIYASPQGEATIPVNTMFSNIPYQREEEAPF